VKQFFASRAMKSEAWS